MAKFQSKPHNIEAFKFTGRGGPKPPRWFIEAHEKNIAQVTMNDKENYIVIYNSKGKDTFQIEKAVIGDWICRVPHGKIYVLDNDSFHASYEKI